MDDRSYATNLKAALSDCIAELDNVKDLFLKNPGKDFSRNRKISFEAFIRICLQMEGSTLQNELLKYFKFEEDTPTASAFIQQRSKVLPEAFSYLFFMFVQKIQSLDSLKTFKSYRILANDGSDVNLPYSPDEKETFEQSGTSRGYNQIHLNAVYDVLNGFYVDCLLEPDRKLHERAAFIRMIDRNYANAPSIYLADRGYESWNLFAHLIETNQKFLIRLKDDDSNGILSTYSFDYDENREFDQYIETILTWKQTNEVKSDRNTYTFIAKKNFDFFSDTDPYYSISLRILCIQVAPGKFEYLATNLDPGDFSLNDIRDLYHLRWDQETSFRDLKYTVGLLSFHAKKTDFLKQEIWAGLILFNFCEAIARHITLSQNNKSKRERKYEHLVNFSGAVCICREFLKRSDASMDVCRLISKYIIPVRPGRAFKRKIKPQSARFFIYRAA